MSGTPKYEAVMVELRRQFAHQADDHFDWMTNPFESPIEKVFVATLLTSSWRTSSDLGTCERDYAWRVALEAGLATSVRAPSSFIDDPEKAFIYADDTSVCISQCWLSLDGRQIRPDFAFLLPGVDETKVIVELDGHDFHERTPEQAQSDKSRDRKLQALGWHVMRFTGREVLRKPWDCLQEVTNLLLAKRALRFAKERADEVAR